VHLDARAVGFGLAGTAQFGVMVVAPPPDRGDGVFDLRIVGAAAQQRPKVVAAMREQAQEQLAFGGQPRAIALAAEGLRDAGNGADFAAAVAVAPALRGFARLRGGQRLERELLLQRRDDLL